MRQSENGTILPNDQTTPTSANYTQKNIDVKVENPDKPKVIKKKKSFILVAVMVVFLLAIIVAVFIHQSSKEKVGNTTQDTALETDESEQENSKIKNRWVEAFDWSKYNVMNNQLAFHKGKVKVPLTIEGLLPVITSCDMHYRTADAKTGKLTPSDMTRTDLIAYQGGQIEIDGYTYDFNFYKEHDDMTYGEIFAKNMYDIFTEQWGVAINHDFGDDEEYDSEYGIRQLGRVFDKYGLPTHVLEAEGILARSPMLFWERDGYRFGLSIMDTGALGGYSKPSLEIQAFHYVPDEAWSGFLERWSSYKETAFSDYISR